VTHLIVLNAIERKYMLMDDISKWIEKTKIIEVIEAIEDSGCIIVNPNYNPVKGIKGGLILRSANKEWLSETIIEILEYLEREKGRNDPE